MNASNRVAEKCRVPQTVAQALDRDWLSWALAPISDGGRVVDVSLKEEVKAMASKLRIGVRFDNAPDREHHLCLKAFLDSDQDAARTGLVTLREAQFYDWIAPELSMRVPRCANVIMDNDAKQAIILMEDIIAGGAYFCDALHPFDSSQVEASLDQLARLHVVSHLLESHSWIKPRLTGILQSQRFSQSWLQTQMHDGRGGQLPSWALDAALLMRALTRLAEHSDNGAQTLLHGDCHIANVYMTSDGPGFADWQLINRGNWALDVAYHVNTVLPSEVAAREERRLVEYYCSALKHHGGAQPDLEAAWADYSRALPYAYFHWCITTRVERSITELNFQRLGAAIVRNESYPRLGIKLSPGAD